MKNTAEYAGTISVAMTFSVLLFSFSQGNIDIFPFSRHVSRCLLIFVWSKKNWPGTYPSPIAVAKAVAKRPQSEPPDCFCALSNLSVIEAPCEQSNAEICSLTAVPTLVYILSKICTSPGLAPTVLISSQFDVHCVESAPLYDVIAACLA